jgi:hypothetical protein
MDIYAQVISRIVKEQQSIIGPIALDQARKVSGLTINSVDDIKINSGQEKTVLTALINEYKDLFGQASVEVCKEAFGEFSDKIPATDVPDILK